MSRSPGADLPSPSLFFDVYALGSSIRQLLAEEMADSPLTPEDYAIYSAVFEEDRISPTRMARLLAMPLTTVMDHIARLERRGHARRTVDPRDRRATLVGLTANGQAAHRAANRFFERAYAAFAAELDMEEAAVARMMASLRGAVERARAGVSPAKSTTRP
jgi:DNA-binding MarR family transcriptional regulator